MAFSFWKKMFGEQPAASKAVAEQVSDAKVAEELDEPVKKSEVVVDTETPVQAEAKGDVLADTEVEAEVVEADSKVTKEGLESFVNYVARSLVDNPEAVSVSTLEKDRLSVIQIRCEKKDIGKIVGKNGKTIAAIRLLVSGAGGRIGLRMTVDVLD